MLQDNASSKIYVVGTPIGNLEDFSPRAIRILNEARVIACEDTRVTRKLLSHFNIHSKELITYADHDEQLKSVSIIERLKRESIVLALVSDAGTPCIADPGYRLIHLARKNKIPVIPIPGPSSPIVLASASGLPTDRILFIGFLPAKASQLNAEIQKWSQIEASIVFFESARRIDKTLKVIAAAYPQAEVCLGRELTKLYEETETLNICEAATWVSTHKELRGEVTVMLHIGNAQQGEPTSDDLDEIVRVAKKSFKQGKSLKDLLVDFKDHGLSRSELYQLLLKAKSEV